MTCHRSFKTLRSGFLLLLISSIWSGAYGQNNKLEEIEMVNMGDGYRIFVQCSGPIKYSTELEESLPRLTIHLPNTTVNLTKNDLTYPHTPVRKISATQWEQSPPAVRIDIVLTHVLKFEIVQKMSTMIFVDLKETDSWLASDNGIGLRDGKASSLAMRKNAVDSRSSSYHRSISVNNGTSTHLPDVLSSNERISLEAKDVEITDVLRLLSKQTRLNIVALRDTGRVTVNLEDVSVKEALDMIAKANGYDYIIDGDAVLVKPRDKFQMGELQTKVFRLQYIEANNLKSTMSQVLSDQARIQVFYNDFQPVQKQQDVGGANPLAGPPSQAPSEKRRSSTVIVTDVPANIRQLEVMIGALDVPAPQIMIEAKLIEISPQADQKLGIDWSKTINAQIFREVLLPSGTPHRFSAEVPIDGGPVNFGTLNLGQYNAVLDFLNTNTNSKLVSNPRILAMDNQTATISVGANIPIPQINRGVGGQGDIVTFQYRDVNISLEVTPHVAGDQTISLHVNPIIEEIVGSVAAGENSAPITSRREVETVVNLKSGETMVIGGLIKESTIETISKVWLLGDVPLIGNLFRHQSKSKKQTDLLIFITPRLVN